MGISVIYTKGEVGNVPGNKLDYLIRTYKIVAFRRSKEWVQIGKDPIRKAQQLLMKPRVARTY